MFHAGDVQIATWKWLRAMCKHEIHHRGQIYAYLGMLGVAAPPLFGLTSEQVRERSFTKIKAITMKITKKLLLFSLFCLFINGWGANRIYSQSLIMNVPFATDPVKINAKQTVFYELRLTNFAADSVVIKKLEVINLADSVVIASFDEEELKGRFSLIEKSQDKDKNILPPNSSGVIYIELALGKNSSEIRLKHHLESEIKQRTQSKLFPVWGAFVKFPKKPAVILGAPLRAGFWAAVYDPSWERGHRRVFYTVDGKTSLPGRFAIDFIRLNDEGRYAVADENFIKNWFGYANEVIAVKDGVIASISDVFPESPTLSEHPKYPPEKATGNYVSINIGNNLVAFYEHLKPGSIRVKPGQKVKKGDVIALLGFTGQTTGPHLHFHVANKNSPLGAEGISFAFEKFKLVGIYSDFEKFGKALWRSANDSSQTNIFKERPPPNSLIKF